MAREYHNLMESTITLTWDPPQGNGTEIIVDNYTIFITPDPPHQSAHFVVLSPLWNVTLVHKEEYKINITAVNCIGKSDATVLPAFSE